MTRSIRASLLLLNLLTFVFLVVVGGIGLFSVNRLDAAMDKIAENSNALSFQKGADQDHDALRADVMNALVVGGGEDGAARQAVAKEASEHLTEFRKLMKELDAVDLDGGIRAKLARTQPDVEAYLKIAAAMVQLSLVDPTAGRAKLGEFDAAFTKLERSMGELSEVIEQDSAKVRASGDAVVQASHWRLLAGGGAAVLLALWAGWVIARRITTPVDEAIGFADRISEGDLSASIDSDAADTSEPGRLKHALHLMQQKLLAMVTEIRSGSERIAHASREISAGNLDLSSRTEEQASSLEETASSLEELTSTVQQNSAHAREAEQLAAEARSVAQRGGQVVADVVETMGAITHASQSISQIIGTIEGIAFQTNILALNAAVEAARAGEQGRGFAVVASEVRTLAQRADSAAKEIKTLIDESSAQVERGGVLVASAGSTMEKVVASVGKVGEMVSEIAGATGEQEVGLGQINSAVAQIDSVTQQNAALVEEAAAAAASMEEQAAALAQLVAVFQLQAGGAPRPRALRLAAA